MDYTAEEERIFDLARQIKEIRTRCFYVCGHLPCAHPKEAKKLRQEIESMGYLVRGEATISAETLEPNIEVKIFKPKENLPPDLAKIYDDWLMARRLACGEMKSAKTEEQPVTDEEFLKKARIKIN